MNSHQRRKFQKSLFTELRNASQSELEQGLIDAAQDFVKQEKKFASLQAKAKELEAEVKYQKQCRYMAIEALNEARLDFNEQLFAEQSKVKLLVDALEEIANWLVCAPIASAVDMAQSFPHMYGVAENALSTVRGK